MKYAILILVLILNACTNTKYKTVSQEKDTTNVSQNRIEANALKIFDLSQYTNVSENEAINLNYARIGIIPVKGSKISNLFSVSQNPYEQPIKQNISNIVPSKNQTAREIQAWKNFENSGVGRDIFFFARPEYLYPSYTDKAQNKYFYDNQKAIHKQYIENIVGAYNLDKLIFYEYKNLSQTNTTVVGDSIGAMAQNGFLWIPAFTMALVTSPIPHSQKVEQRAVIAR